MTRTWALSCLALSCLSLSACGDSTAVKHAKWMEFCTHGDFNPKQCEVLYAIKESSDSARDAADYANVSAGMAAGFSAASMGSRR